METVQEQQPLLGVDPDDTAEVRVRGAVVVVGVIDRAAWDVLRSRAADDYLQVFRRKVAEIAAEGGDPSALADPDSPTKMTVADLRTVQDEEFQARATASRRALARLAVRGHSGILDRKTRAEVPFATEQERTAWGEVRRVVSLKTLRWYEVNGLMADVDRAARELNGLGDAEKKG
jgi:hypothetical protein